MVAQIGRLVANTQQSYMILGSNFGRRQIFRQSNKMLPNLMSKRSSQSVAIDGSIVGIKNPNFKIKNPIWKPYIKFQDYWRLVKSQPDGPSETYHCSYLVEWSNQTARSFRGLIEKPDQIFEEKRLSWMRSRSCESLRSCVEELLETKEVTKIICFGLGDMCRKPPEWMSRQNKSGELDLDISVVEGSMIQHSVALTIADIYHKRKTGKKVRLLAQDPEYTEQTVEILKVYGFEIVGRFGAGGVAEIDEESVVICAFVAAPAKQIIADIARPALVITTGFEAFNNSDRCRISSNEANVARLSDVRLSDLVFRRPTGR
ncbi:hypothetical protein BX600DRAFT_149878 [Xylariales sp. PMI_506]|nr:hypothetical protein BX600DRAFT_149878 [Xylariales sp. PMI_506]